MAGSRMFSRLRNRLIIVNMSITSIVVVLAFSVIYFITYNNAQSDIRTRLDSRSAMLVSVAEPGANTPAGAENERTVSSYENLDGPLPVVVQVDGSGRILDVASPAGIPREACEAAAETVWNSKNQNSTISFEGRQWRHAISQIKMKLIQGGQEQVVAQDRYQILFLDVTEYNRTLSELRTTLLLVGVVTLLAILVISIRSANRAIRPVVAAWNKQKQFVADASHELKTPLSIINANYDALLMNPEETVGSQARWLNAIRVGTDSMTKLVNDMLSLAKIDDIDVVSERVPFSISEAVNEMASSIEATVIGKSIELVRSVEPDIVMSGDQNGIKRAIAILLDNATKYTNEGGRMEVTLAKSGHCVTFAITNSGKGISQTDLPRVFDRFYRGDVSRTHDSEVGGHGLGLSIAKAIIEGSGGEIHAESVENEYTTFTFTLGL